MQMDEYTAPGAASPGSPRAESHRRRNLIVAGLCVLAAVLVAFGWAARHRKSTTAARSGASTGGTNAPPIPVVAGVVTQEDVPIYLEGLGTVQAFDTVTVHSRSDGQLQQVAFTEGQEVHAGDLYVADQIRLRSEHRLNKPRPRKQDKAHRQTLARS